MSLPATIQNALDSKPQSRYVDINGTRIHYLIWNEDKPELPGILFVHGFRGHAHWWDAVAPAFADNYRVAALDLSGMGDSGYRDSYDGSTPVQDILGVIRHANFTPAIVVGHSFGGSRTILACIEDPSIIARAIVIDSFFNFPSIEDPRLPPDPGGRRTYPDRETTLSRFRLAPPQPVEIEELIAHVAVHSIMQTDEGWTWKFDPNVRPGLENDGESMLRKTTVHVDYIYGECSTIIDRERAERIVATLPNTTRGPIEIPGAYHHIMLDHPLELIAALRVLLR